MADVTAPGSPEAPVSRRAARALREEAARRAHDTDAEVTVDTVPTFVLPDDPIVPGAAPVPSIALPSSLPIDFLPPVSASRPPLPRSAAPQLRPRPRRDRLRPDRRESARRAARAEQLLIAHDEDDAPARHVRRRRLARLGVVALIAAGGVLLVGSTAAVTALMSGVPPVADAGDTAVARMAAEPQTVAALPIPTVEQAPVLPDICSDPAVMAAIEAHDDAAAIETAGGGEAFRVAVAGGHAPCVDLADPTRVWAVIDKLRPYDPIDYRPTGLVMPDGVRSIEGGSLRTDAASALSEMVTAAREAGAGELALESGFRSFETQQGSYGRQVDAKGTATAELVSAQPGFSEHQSGLAADVVACAGACGTIDDLAATAQGQWVAEHAWEHGWIVRYVEGATGVTGYMPEPWHLRYVGPELARCYHDGGWTSLEEFFGLPPAPDYAG